MEQESRTPLLYNTIKRVRYRLVIGAHVAFITLAFAGTIILLLVLVLGNVGLA